jgi:hypothetical protein
LKSASSVFKEKEFWILILVILAFFYPALLLDETLFYRDLFYVSYFQAQHVAEFLKDGQVPLWDPYLGQPLLGEPSTGTTLYPSLLLYFVFSPVKAMNLNIILHAVLSAFGMYWLARELNFDSRSSLLAALIFVFCGYALSYVNILRFYSALPYFPILILFWHRFHLTRAIGWFIATVLAGFFQILSGGVEFWILSVATTLGWAISNDYPEVKPFQKLYLWFLVVLSMIGLSSIQILPALERVALSNRAAGIDFDTLTIWSLHPKRLPETIVPGFLGSAGGLNQTDYWGRRLEPIYPPFILSIYFGFFCVVLGSLGGFIRGNTVIPVRVRRFLLFLFAASILISFGRHLPFSRELYDFIPIKILRYPIKVLALGILPIALLSATTFEKFFLKECPSKKLITVLTIFSALILFHAILYTRMPGFGREFERFFFQEALTSGQSQSLHNSILYAASISVITVLLFLYRNLKPKSWQSWVIVGVIGTDLLIAAIPLNLYGPADFFRKEPNVVALIRQEIGDGKLYRAPTPQNIQLNVPSNDMFWGARWELEILRHYLASAYRIPVFYHQGIDDMAQTEVQKLRNVLHSLPWSKRLPFLSAANVTLIMTDENVTVPGLLKVATVHNQSNFPFYLYKNKMAPGDAFFVEEAIPVTSFEDALNRMKTAGYDPAKSVVVETTRTESPDTPNCQPASVKKLRSDLSESAYKVETPCDGYFVFTHAHYPGWKYKMDGKSVEALKANAVFTALPLKEGHHEIVRFYRPDSWLWGGCISLVFSIVLLIAFRKNR